MSFVEVYMEKIVDLLNPSHSLHLHENSLQGVYIQPKRIALPSYPSFVRTLASASAKRTSLPIQLPIRAVHIQYFTSILAMARGRSILRIVDLAGMQMNPKHGFFQRWSGDPKDEYWSRSVDIHSCVHI